MAYQLIANAPPIPIIVVSGPALSFPGGVASNFDLAAAIAASVPSNETPIGVSTTPSLLAGLSTTVSPLRVVYDGAGAGGVLAQTDFLVRTQNYVIAYRVPSVTITSGTLTAPQNFQATSTLAPAAVLTWDAVPSATLYKVWRSVVDGPDAGYSLVNTVGDRKSVV